MTVARAEPADGQGRDRDARRALLRVFRDYAGSRLWGTAALVFAAAILEGVGVLLLVPLISLVLGDAEGTVAAGRAGEIAAGIFSALGVQSKEGQLALGLGVFLAVVGLRAIVDLARARSMTSLALGFVVALRAHFFGAIAEAPWGAVAGLDREAAGHSLSVDLSRAEGFVWAFWTALLAAGSLAVYGVIAMAVSPAMTAVALAVGGALFLALRPLRRRAARLGTQMSGEDAGFYGQTGRFLAGLKPARAHRLSREHVARSLASARRVADRAGALQMDLARSGIVVQTTVAVTAVVIVLSGVMLADAGAETLIAMLLVLVRIVRPFQTLQHALQNIASSAASYQAADDRLRAAVASAPFEPSVSPRAVDRAPGLRLVNASASAGGVRILDGVSCQVPAGRVTLIAGFSGAGKTTLCDLLAGLLVPEGGDFEIDGQRADAALRAGLAEALAYVGQEPFLVEPTLRENLGWGARGADDSAMRAALAAVGADGLVAWDAGGLDMPVGVEATRFSGGERQRLRLARAILRAPRLVVLDEATNALDAAAESDVLSGLRRELPDATIVIVSHRPAALAIADHVVWLEAGRVVEEGASCALRADPSSRTANWWRSASSAG